MKISVNYWMFEGGSDGSKPIVEAMEEAVRAGYDAIELCIASEGVLTPSITEAECAAIADRARSMGLEISSLASGESWRTSPTSSDPGTRRCITNFTERALQVARWLGTDAYLYVPGAVEAFSEEKSEIVPYDVCYARAKETLQQLVPTAERLGVTIGVENVWNKFLLSPLEMRDFVDSLGSPRVGVYFDVGNIVSIGYPEHWISILGPRITRVHVKDFKRSIGTMEGFVDLLEGDVNWAAVKRALEEIGYDGYVTAEVCPFLPGRLEKTAQALRTIFEESVS